MATGDVLSICNRALLAVGARQQVSSINPSDGSAEANACSVLFTPTFEALARTASWNCLGRQVTLSLLMAAQGTPENPLGTSLPLPPSPWLYAYAYPVDCLDVRYIVPSFPSATGTVPDLTNQNSSPTWLPSGGQIPFKVQTVLNASDQSVLTILTNQDLAQAVYTTNLPVPASWDSLFQQAMVASLGVYLVPALSLSLQLMTLSIQTAEKAINLARARDGNEGVTSMDHIPDWITARAGSGGWGPGLSGSWGPYNGYFTNMIWPSDGTYGD